MNWLKDIVRQKLAVTLGIGVVLLLIGLQIGLFSKLQSKAYQSRDWVSHTATVLEQVDILVGKIRDAELSERAYLLTGEPSFLRLFYLGTGQLQQNDQANLNDIIDKRSIHEVLRNIVDLTQDNVDQQKRLAGLGKLVDRKIDISRGNISTRAATPLSPTAELDAIKAGFETMRDIRTISAEILATERQLLNDRRKADQQTETNLTYFICAAAIITYVVLFLLIGIVIRSLFRSRQIMQESARKEAYFRAAAEGALNAFLIFEKKLAADFDSADLSLEYLNPMAERMIGARLSASQNRALAEVMPLIHGSQKETHELYQLAIRENCVQEREYLVSNGPFAGRYLQEQIVPLPTGIAVSCRDITERRQIESMKNEFVSTVSHELRTPLTAIRGSLGLIVGGIAGEISTEAKAMLNIAYNNCERLVRLINDILDIEKIEAGRMVFDRRPLAILAFLRQAIETNTAFAERYGVSLILDINLKNSADETTNVYADFDRLMQVATNLISNAVKFSRRDGSVTVSCTVTEGKARIEVSDSGIGIPRRFHGQIFQKFAQADGSDSRQKGGTGLGLSIAKSIIEEMDGSMDFESEEEVGTSFFFTLPVIAQASPPPQPTSIAGNGNNNRRVLICEDDADIANLLSMIIEKEGLSCDISNDATSAISCLQQQPYLALILDLMLPDKCGISLIRDIRADMKLTDLPIVVVSAKADAGQRLLKGSAISIVDWMSKPIDAERLVSTIRSIGQRDVLSKILHVEDDKDLADVLKLSLADITETTWVATLREAREKLEQQPFDLVVLDVGLPDGSGFDLLPLLDAGGRYPTPVVLFTANEIPREVATEVAAAMVKSKTSENELVQTIKRLVREEIFIH